MKKEQAEKFFSDNQKEIYSHLSAYIKKAEVDGKVITDEFAEEVRFNEFIHYWNYVIENDLPHFLECVSLWKLDKKYKLIF